jgi:proteic killer suppression protein
VFRYKVDLSKISHLLEKKLPKKIAEKIYIWALQVEMEGLPETRKIVGFHDEPLRGLRAGQRSIRLNRAYRLFYIENVHGVIVIVKVIEVNKHEY